MNLNPMILYNIFHQDKFFKLIIWKYPTLNQKMIEVMTIVLNIFTHQVIDIIKWNTFKQEICSPKIDV